MAWVYLLRCADGTLYCGWTVDLDQRLAAHNAGRASRYTRSRLPVELAWSREQPDRARRDARGGADQGAAARGKLALIARGEASGPCRSQSPAAVLVAEPIAESGVELLRERFEVDLALDWSREELARADRRLRRHRDPLGDAARRGVIGRAERLKVIGRAGIGVDNVDVAAATKRGIVVANAPQSNIVAAAEHTLALMLALARNVPQAHASLTAGRWERSRFGGVEVYEKTLGVLGFGRIGQLVAARARAFGMRIVAFDPFVSAERYRELGVEQARDGGRAVRAGGLHHAALPKTARRAGSLDAAAFARCATGAGDQLRARRAGRRRGVEGRAGLGQGGGRGAGRVPERADH